MLNKSIKLKHHGDMINTGVSLWKKGWFVYPKEGEKSEEGYRLGRIGSYLSFAITVYGIKVMMII